MEINPLLIKEYNKSKSLCRTKTDKLYAKAIDGYKLAQGYHLHQISFYQKFSLKQLTRLSGSLVSQRSRCLVHWTNVLNCIFPELKSLFHNKFLVTTLYIVAYCPSPKATANMNVCSYDILRRKPHGKFNMDKIVKLKELAKNTVGVNTDCYRVELEMLINLYAQLDSRIDELDTQITKIIQELNPPPLSIKGIGPVSAAVIVSEFGDISRFATPDKVLPFASLEQGLFQSGTTEYSGHMVKHGSAVLRYTLMNCDGTVRLYNKSFAAYYQKKISEGKPPTMLPKGWFALFSP